MYQADIQHSDQTLEEKLHQLYVLNRAKAMDLGFRPPYLNLLEKFGNPQRHLPPVIHVAGTNGKGSMIAMMRAIFEAGGRCGHAYTSPHLRRFNERIVLAGEEIKDQALEGLIDEALALNDGGEVTFFEVTTAMAFSAFSHTEADVCLLEVGMGGRLDCTNVIEAPAITIIGAISRDHTEHLGETIEEIAFEKAGIMKAGVPCVVGAQPHMDKVLPVFEVRANELGVELFVHGRDWGVRGDRDKVLFTIDGRDYEFPRPGLVGEHQVENAGSVLAALYALKDQFDFDQQQISKGLMGVVWPARLEQISDDPEVWYDGGHNDSAAAALVEQIRLWKRNDDKPLHLIVGMKADKDFLAFVEPLLPLAQGFSLVPVEAVGACLKEADISALKDQFAHIKFDTFLNVSEALEHHCDKSVRVLVCGSLYLASQITNPL